MRYNNTAPRRKRRDCHPWQRVSTLRCACKGSRNCRETRPRLVPRATASAPAEVPGKSLGRQAAGPTSRWADKPLERSARRERHRNLAGSDKSEKNGKNGKNGKSGKTRPNRDGPNITKGPDESGEGT